LPRRSKEEQFLEDAIKEAGLDPDTAAKLRNAGSTVKARSTSGMMSAGAGHGAPRQSRHSVTRF
jgi:hypothetical protein